MRGQTPPHPHLKLGDVEAELQGEIGAEVMRMLQARDERGSKATDSQVYLSVLESWGVDCPHRFGVGGIATVGSRTMRQCLHCGTVVVTRRDG
jgi:hypothetical protein